MNPAPATSQREGGQQQDFSHRQHGTVRQGWTLTWTSAPKSTYPRRKTVWNRYGTLLSGVFGAKLATGVPCILNKMPDSRSRAISLTRQAPTPSVGPDPNPR